MNDFLKRTKMIEEAKEQGRKIFPAFELLIFMAVYIIAANVQAFVFSFFSLFYYLNDDKLILISKAEKPDFNALFERMLELTEVMPEWLIILNIFLSLFFALFAIIYCRFIDKRRVSTLGIRKGHVISEWIVGSFSAFVLVTVLAVLGVAMGVIKFNGFNGISPFVYFFYCIALFIQAFSQEILIRGYYLSAIAKSSGPVYALVSSGVLSVLIYTMSFSVFEISPVIVIGIVNTFLYAVFAGLYVLKRGNIWGITAFSFIWNLSRLIIFGFNVDGNIDTSSVFNFSNVAGFDTVNGGVLGIDHGLLVTLVIFIGIGVLLKAKQNPREIAVLSENKNDEENK